VSLHHRPFAAPVQTGSCAGAGGPGAAFTEWALVTIVVSESWTWRSSGVCSLSTDTGAH
jgi:hypothetical protein